jgi:hypothetical protein
MIETANHTHLGDNLIHLNYLRRLGRPARHYCCPEYIAQLQPLTEGTEIELIDLHHKTPQAVDSWSNKMDWLKYQKARADWVTFHLRWFEHLSHELGVASPIKTSDDLLFDYPKLYARKFRPIDYLILNCPPRSGQFPNFNQNTFKHRVKWLQDQGFEVWTAEPVGICESTREHGLDVSEIGNLSCYATHILSIDTGPLWPTFNVKNKDTVESREILGHTYKAFSLAPNVKVSLFLV